LVEVFDQATEAGRGVMTDEAGQMVDLAVVRQARRVVESAAAARGQGDTTQ
jgi:citrate lyase beta subunit